MDARFTHLLTAQVLTAVVGFYPYIVRRSKVAYYFAGAHLFLALWCLNESIAFLSVSHGAKLTLFRLSYMLSVPMVWYFFYFLLGMAEIPVSRFPKNWRAIQFGGILTIVLCFTPWLTANIDEHAHPFKEIPGPAYWMFIVFMLWGLGMALYQLGHAYKNSHGHTRTQLKYLFIACSFQFLEGVIFFVSLYVPGISYSYFYLQVLYSLILAYTIVAYRLMDITVIIRKTLEYSLLTAVLAGVYIGIITGAAYWIEGWAKLSSSYSAAFAAAAVAMLFHPLRTRIQKGIDQKFFRRRTETVKNLDTYTAQLACPVSAHDVAKALFEVLDGSLHVKRMGLYLRAPDQNLYRGYRFPQESQLPSMMSPEDPLISDGLKRDSVSLISSGEFKSLGVLAMAPMIGASGLIGFLLVGEKLSETALDENDQRFILTVLQQATQVCEQLVLFENNPEWLHPALLADVARGFVHEIKTPLANINLPAQATMMDLSALEAGTRSVENLLPKFKDRMKYIMAQTIKASERIDSIRQLATVEDLRVEPVDVSVVLHESMTSLEPVLEETGIRVHYQVPTGLCLVRANAKQLEIVFVNLIKNAAEAMSVADIPEQNRHLWLTMGKEDDHQIVEVKDSGPGITPENMQHVFDQHFTTKGTRGTGIGLHISRQIVEAIGGTLTVSSAPQKGATFRVSLPTLNPQKKSQR